jgi:glutathione S-transferase
MHLASRYASHKEPALLTLFDYLPSQNAWKVRLLLNQLGTPYHTVAISIFEGEGRSPAYRQINPAGKVPAIRIDDERTLAESNAILAYLSDGTPYLPSEPFARAKVHQWLSFEQEHVEMTIGSLRYWTMTGKLPRRSQKLIDDKRAAALRTLGILDRELSARPFLADERYTIADISVFAYCSRAEEAGISLAQYPHVRAWITRVEAQPRFIGTVYPYSIDPHSSQELP